jgi:iron-sulfur cluster repair protein YtfE (RIC family)
MANKQAFSEALSKHFETLKLYVPIVAKVHGKHHPEFYKVHKLYDAIINKAKESGAELPDLAQEFIELREATNSYTVPDDVCESYEAVYHMLKELDEAYEA